ncbi:PREDICTED: protein disulfide isomerase-like 5-1 [Theobroma cacao]|uniref:Protein disulfide isomerase-like 5-1 n=1 Tax=Theobroma cacao TaxID=3641 RepID=A0AB32URS1_THECC|nr:PREDICTED: protein disulfide isomerase-like 5-1 [Theobroma cacao]XP_007015471.2 PREDICTED: protein disulfide isomerase-like 5-1 [Theobroma cacao]XP_007015474.2 PREDICTED: protein disulfide isomerase-like 5-1 [Theobroma cacao]
MWPLFFNSRLSRWPESGSRSNLRNLESENLQAFYISLQKGNEEIKKTSFKQEGEKSRSPAMKSDRRFTLLLLLLFLISITVHTEAEVITLTPDTFSDKVKEKDTAWFVKFCVPWCKHCKNLGTLWDDLGKAMEGEDEIEIGEVDCGVSKPVCAKVDIHSYPTFKLFYDGEEVAKYQGPRDVESLKTFAVEEAEKAAENAQLGIDKEL